MNQQKQGLDDATHILQVLPGPLSERTFDAMKNREAELQEQKKKLEEQLQQLQQRNDELAKRLAGIDTEVGQQVTQAKALLVDVAKAR